jgi:ABC-type transport system involved in cytochrome bd biosynthesis fused ATPase/permease subunit
VKSKDLRLLLSQGSSRKLFFVVALAAPFSAAIVIANALLLGAIIVGLIYKHPDTFQWILVLAGLWIVRAVFTAYFENWCSKKASEIKNELRASTTAAIGEIDPLSPSELSGLLIKGANSLDTYLGRFLPQLFSAALTPIGVIATIFFLDPLSALIALFTLPLIPFFGALIGRFTSDSVSKKWRTLGSLSRYFEDSLQGFLTLRIFGRHRSQGERIQKMGDQYTDETMSVLKISFLSALVLELAATISVALIAVSIGLRLVDGKISFIHGLTVLILAPEVYFPLRNAASLYHASADGTEILERLREVESNKSPIIQQVERDFSNAQLIEWDRWQLDIPGVAQSTIAAAAVKRGEALFIVGESGIGKTTFAENLLGVHFDCDLTIDSVLLQPEHISEFQRHLGWIPQLPQLAPGSIREQFQLVAPKITDAEIVASLAELSLPVSELPFGLDSTLGGSDEKSAQLSGGQIRKVAVARALIRSPFLIIADEPTADLDSQSSMAIMNALRRAVSQGSAMICITHDMELVGECDRVVAVERVIA